MKNQILVVGAESTGTRFASRFVAKYLNIEGADTWNCLSTISDNAFTVVHRSLPHGDNRFFTDWPLYAEQLGTDRVIAVVICMRDIQISAYSKVSRAGISYETAITENLEAMAHIQALTHVSNNWGIGMSNVFFQDYERVSWSPETFLTLLAEYIDKQLLLAEHRYSCNLIGRRSRAVLPKLIDEWRNENIKYLK